ncbi:MAG: glycoside hydrolase family 2 protein, partial [Clostridia bacterium]|nr:glycoside hydrolase family 2 protein [Clostridia bacterium]
MRKITTISDDWRFLKADLPIEQAVAYAERGEAVRLPHTWNAIDGQDGGNDYHRGRCWYVREVKAEELSGEVSFLEVNGASHTAEVYLDGQLLVRHEGGYATFRVELPHPGTRAIAVDNRDSDRVYPQKADFTFYGGLYRDVNIVSVPSEHFELAKDGTPGIKVTPVVDLKTGTATVTVETWHNGQTVDISVNGETKTVENTAVFTIENAHLWDGIDDPYLYTAAAKLPGGDEISAR